MKHADEEVAEQQIAKRTTEVSILKDQLIRAMVARKLKQEHFDEQIGKVEAELSAAQDQRVNAMPKRAELAEVLDFAKWVLENASPVWLVAQHDKKLRIQKAFFPTGLTVTDEGFGTPTLFNCFKTSRRS